MLALKCRLAVHGIHKASKSVLRREKDWDWPVHSWKCGPYRFEKPSGRPRRTPAESEARLANDKENRH